MWAALLVVYVGWGSTYLGIRVMVETIPPLLGAGVRYLTAGVLLAAWLRMRRGPGALRVGGAELRTVVLVACLLLLGGNGLLTVGEKDVPAGIAALVVATVPLWIIILRLGLGDRPPRAGMAATALGFLGVGVLLLPGERPQEASLAGMLIILVAAASWATGSVVSGRRPMPGDASVATTLEMLVGGAALVLVGAAVGELGELRLGEISTRSAVGLAYLIGPGSILAFSAYVWLLQNAPLSLVATYAFVNPVVAVALGALILGEALSLIVLVGAAMIVSAVGAVVVAGRG